MIDAAAKLVGCFPLACTPACFTESRAWSPHDNNADSDRLGTTRTLYTPCRAFYFRVRTRCGLSVSELATDKTAFAPPRTKGLSPLKAKQLVRTSFVHCAIVKVPQTLRSQAGSFTSNARTLASSQRIRSD